MTPETTTPTTTPKQRTGKPAERNFAAELAEPFLPEAEKTLTKGGVRLTYLPVAEIITRLNNVFGVCGWSSQILRCERDQFDRDFVIAHVRLEANVGSIIVAHEGFGGQKIKRTKSGDPVDLGDEFKGAVSDALKKAAQQFGIGLYLARDEQIIEAEQAQAAAEEIDPEILQRWENFTTVVRDMTAEQRQTLNDFWTEHAAGRPKPTLATATIEDLDALLVECLRISTGGEIVD